MAVIDSIPSRADQLAIEPTISPEARAHLRRGADLFDGGHYWDAHETWEAIWQEERRPIRSFYQGLIQIAAGLHHWTVTHRPIGVERKLAEGIAKLSWYRPAYLGIDVARLIAEAEDLRAQAVGQDARGLAAHPPAPPPTVPRLESAPAEDG